MSRTETLLNGQAEAEVSRYDVNPNEDFGEGEDMPELEGEGMEAPAEQRAPQERKYRFSERTLAQIEKLPKDTLALAGIHFDDYADRDRRTGREFTRKGLITRAEQQGGLTARAVEHLAWGEWTDVPIPVNVFPEVLSREIPTMALIRLDYKTGMIADFRIQNPNLERSLVSEDTILATKMRYFDDHGAIMEVGDRDKLAMFYQGGIGRLPGSSGAFVMHPADPSIIMKKSPEGTAKLMLARMDAETQTLQGVYYAKGEKHTFSFNASEAKRFASGEDVYITNEQGEGKYLRYNPYSNFFVPSITTKFALEKADKFLKERAQKKNAPAPRQEQRQQQAEQRQQKLM